ncbi:MAG TPA: hypothetical protein ENI07_22065 [Desulfobacterales bacterium]|nr:hypothetical protein [Desulfobacterales bacterium]
MTYAPRQISFLTVSLCIIMMVAVGTLVGCVGAKQREADEALVESYASADANPKSAEISKLNEQLFASVRSNTDRSDYLLGAGDLIELKVFEAANLDTKARVSSRGQITLPLLGQVGVKGLSAREAEEKIERLFAARYIKNPHISIFVKERYSQRVTIAGKVKKPGTYDLVSRQRLLDVLGLAGGLSEEAGPTVQVRRSNTDTGESQVFLVDLERMIKEGNADLNIEINGGDVIFIPEAGVFFVDGAVRKPGSYHIKQQMIIQEAVMSAGGFAPWANRKQVTLIRYNDAGKREVRELDLESDPEGYNIEIRDRDVIVAKGSGWGKMIHGTGISIGVPGIIGFGYKSPEQ